MIVHIDHIALSSELFKEDRLLLESLGYQQTIYEKNVPNLYIKKGLLTVFKPHHDLALFRKKDSLSIEVLHHGKIEDKDSFIVPIFKNLPANNIWRNKQISYVSEKSPNQMFEFNRFIVKAADVDKTLDFWQCFGYKVLARQDNEFIMEFFSLLTQERHILIVQHSARKYSEFFLNDRGFNCIGYITNSADKERTRLMKKGISVTEIEELSLNAGILRIFFAIGPEGEMVELIEKRKLGKEGLT